MKTHALASTTLTLTCSPSVSGHFTHCWVSLCASCRQFFYSCRCNHVLNFDLCANSLYRFTLRKRVCWGVVFTPPVGCSRPPSAVNDLLATNSWKPFVWGFIHRPNTTGFHVLSKIFACILICRLSLNYYKDHQDPFHCHQLEEELDDGCRSWYFQ